MNASKSDHPEEEPFSDSLETWLKSDTPKTVVGLGDVFSEKSFALTFLILMSIPALPLPTGGVTHVFEVIVMLLCLELIAQRNNIWLPKRWQKKEIGKRTQTKMIPKLISIIRKVEKISKPRMSWFLSTRLARTLFGVAVLVLTLGAFLAPPFSALDTLPSLGVMFLCLGIILEDIVIVIFGAIIGATGLTISIGFGAAFVSFIGHVF